MERQEQRIEEEQVRTLSTPALVRHALTEVQILVRAELLHAKHELREELKEAQSAGVFLGAGLVLALVGIAALFMAIALALPIAPWLGAVIVGVVVLLAAGGLAFYGFTRLPKKPLPQTQERLKSDVEQTRQEVMQ